MPSTTPANSHPRIPYAFLGNFGLLVSKLSLGSWQTEAVSHFTLFADLSGCPRARASVEGPALRDHEVHRAYGLLNGGVWVRLVAENDVHILLIESLGRNVRALDDVVATETTVIRAHRVNALRAVKDFGSDHTVLPVPDAIGDALLHHVLLSESVTVHLGVAEEAHAVLEGGLHHLVPSFRCVLVASIYPTAQREFRHQEDGVAEEAVGHASRLVGRSRVYGSVWWWTGCR
ncbi:hypothetical protein ON010_g12612 [Phytophthora cinnamomi]|nr:hypothetical protein ON010_g12612 [Phytophthora cinnamomi]